MRNHHKVFNLLVDVELTWHIVCLPSIISKSSQNSQSDRCSVLNR